MDIHAILTWDEDSVPNCEIFKNQQGAIDSVILSIFNEYADRIQSAMRSGGDTAKLALEIFMHQQAAKRTLLDEGCGFIGNPVTHYSETDVTYTYAKTQVGAIPEGEKVRVIVKADAAGKLEVNAFASRDEVVEWLQKQIIQAGNDNAKQMEAKFDNAVKSLLDTEFQAMNAVAMEKECRKPTNADGWWKDKQGNEYWYYELDFTEIKVMIEKA